MILGKSNGMYPYANAFLNEPIDFTVWSVRVQNCLQHYHEAWSSGTGKPLKYLGDLVQVKPQELLRVPNFGKKSLKELEETLSSMGLHLGMDVNGTKARLQSIYLNISNLFEEVKKLERCLDNDSPSC